MHQEEITEFWMMHLKKTFGGQQKPLQKSRKGLEKILETCRRNQALKSTTFRIKANLYLFKNTNYFLNAFNIQLLKGIQL